MIRISAVFVILLATFTVSGCFIVPNDAVPFVEIESDLATKNLFRGMVNNDAPVLQSSFAVSLPTHAENSELQVKAWGNMDLQNDNGDAWFPDGHAGEFSQIDFEIIYTDEFFGFDVASGLLSYSLQNPDDFPRAGERGETREVFAHASRLVEWDLEPFLRVHYDFDEVDGLYIVSGVSRNFVLRDDLSINAMLSQGYIDKSQAEWIYGTSLGEDGAADLRLTSELLYQYDPNTIVRFSANYSTIIDSELSDWFDTIGIDPDNFWVALGVSWSAG